MLAGPSVTCTDRLVPFPRLGEDAMTVSAKRQRHDSLRTVLNSILEEHGGSIENDGSLYLREHHSLEGILRCLIKANRSHVVILNFALGKVWDCMGGRRTAVLRSIVGEKALPAMQQKLMNCATAYRRWQFPQGNHTWT